MSRIAECSPLRRAGAVLLDAVFPPRCAGCRVWSETLFCAACRASLQPVGPPLCARCGLSFAGQTYPADVCADCRSNRYHGVPAFEAVRSPFGFEGAMRHAVHRFKYQNRTALAAPLAALLHEFVLQSSTRDTLHIDEIEAIVAVPLHPWRRYRRGYNQSELLARELGRILDVPARGLLRRTRHTAPQVELTENKRRENVRGAFALAESAGGRLPATVLLLDDVCTTAATLNECARVLKAGGVSRVFGLTLARSS